MYTLYFISGLAVVETAESLYSNNTTQCGVVSGAERSAEFAYNHTYKRLRRGGVSAGRVKLDATAVCTQGNRNQGVREGEVVPGQVM